MDKICQKCGQANPSDAAFCRQCAAPLAQNSGDAKKAKQPWENPTMPPQNFAPQSPQPPKSGEVSRRAYTAIGMVVGGLVCCGPFTAIPGAILGWMEMTAIKAGQSPSGGLLFSQIALWGGIAVALIGSIVYLFLFLGILSGSMMQPQY